jgi:hypothetical protein
MHKQFLIDNYVIVCFARPMFTWCYLTTFVQRHLLDALEGAINDPGLSTVEQVSALLTVWFVTCTTLVDGWFTS